MDSLCWWRWVVGVHITHHKTSHEISSLRLWGCRILAGRCLTIVYRNITAQDVGIGSTQLGSTGRKTLASNGVVVGHTRNAQELL